MSDFVATLTGKISTAGQGYDDPVAVAVTGPEGFLVLVLCKISLRCN